MTFPGRAQAENEAHRALRQARLVRVRHHRGAEQRRGFQGVLGQKVGADQKPALGRELGMCRHQLPQLLKAIQEALPQLKVALRKVGRDLLQQRPTIASGTAMIRSMIPLHASRIPRLELPQKNP